MSDSKIFTCPESQRGAALLLGEIKVQFQNEKGLSQLFDSLNGDAIPKTRGTNELPSVRRYLVFPDATNATTYCHISVT